MQAADSGVHLERKNSDSDSPFRKMILAINGIQCVMACIMANDTPIARRIPRGEGIAVYWRTNNTMLLFAPC
jgi:hypothetical protein